MSSKCSCMSITYHKSDVDPPEISLWDNVDILCQKKKVTREQQMVTAKEPRVGISVQYISNMDIIDTLVSMVTQKAKQHFC
jgi:hypothetical protein